MLTYNTERTRLRHQNSRITQEIQLISLTAHEESKQLGVVVDQVLLGRAQQTTWRTDAGDLDVLTDVSYPGSRAGFEQLAGEAVRLQIGSTTVDPPPRTKSAGRWASFRKNPPDQRFRWRRERDSNPRRPESLNGFRDRPIRPLWHPSWDLGG